jgi:hypothetical protein
MVTTTTPSVVATFFISARWVGDRGGVVGVGM